MNDMDKVIAELRKPFHPSAITWKPGAIKGERALAMPYADLRAYMNRLDEVCGMDWSCAYEPWGDDRIICRLTIGSVTRSSTGETTNESERSEIGGTVAEAQAFKRASAMFGLGRYLYSLPTGWVDWDAAGKKFTDKAKTHLLGILTQHYRRATEGAVDTAIGTPPHQRLFGQLTSGFGEDAEDVRPWIINKWTEKATPANTRNSATELSDTEKDLLADYIKQNLTTLQRIWKNHKTKQAQPA